MLQECDSCKLNSILQLNILHVAYAFPSLFCSRHCYGLSCCAVLCCAVLNSTSKLRQHAGTCLVIREARAGQAIKLSAVKVCDITFSIAPATQDVSFLVFDVLLLADCC